MWGQNFLGLMKKNEVKSVDFTSGISEDELKTLLRGLAKRKGLKAIQDGLSAISASHITINSSIYVTLDAQDVVLEKGAQLLEREGEK